MTRAALHQIVDELPDAEVDDIATLLDAYRHDRVLVQSLLAPEVEPEPDEEAATKEDLHDAAPIDEVCARLGLL